MTERSPDPHDEQSSAVQHAPAAKFGFLPQAVALAGVVVITVIVTLWVSRDSAQPGIEVLIPPPAPVTFQVAGEVVRPGVYSLDGDPRVDDAINAAGGLTADADDRQINLALRVRDGAKVVVPALGSTTAASNSGDSAGVGANGADDDSASGRAPAGETVSADSATLAGLIDLNTATKDQLIALPGIGGVRADSIIEWRTNNLISSANDLLAISGIGPATVNSIRNHVTQP